MGTGLGVDVRACPSCRVENPAGAKYCGACGGTLDPGPPPCPACGETPREGTRFCNACGADLVGIAATRATPALTTAPRPWEKLPAPGWVIGAAGAAVAAIAVVIIAVLVFSGVFGGGGDGDEGQFELLELPDVPLATDPGLLAALQAAADALPEAEGANDREQVRSMIGPPDTFTVTFERSGEHGEGPVVRYEMWFYYDLGTAYEFADGAFVQDMPMTLPQGPAILPPRGYDPALFERSTTWDEVTALLVDPGTFEPIELEPEYEVQLTFYSGEQLIVAFDDEGLVYVETVALAEDTEEAAQ